MTYGLVSDQGWPLNTSKLAKKDKHQLSTDCSSGAGILGKAPCPSLSFDSMETSGSRKQKAKAGKSPFFLSFRVLHCAEGTVICESGLPY